MKRIYRPIRVYRPTPADAIDFWIGFLFLVCILVYAAWRWV